MKAGERVTIRRGKTVDSSCPGWQSVQGADLSGCSAIVVDPPTRCEGLASDGKVEDRVRICPTEGPSVGQILDIPVDKVRRRAIGGVVDDAKRAVKSLFGGIGPKRARPGERSEYRWDKEERKLVCVQSDVAAEVGQEG